MVDYLMLVHPISEVHEKEARIVDQFSYPLTKWGRDAFKSSVKIHTGNNKPDV